MHFVIDLLHYRKAWPQYALMIMLTLVLSIGTTKLDLIHLLVFMLTPWVWTIRLILARDN